jgi:glycosyltransferase involved in cell wall biosynthesis
MYRSIAAAPPRSRAFASFWQGGYEGADHFTHGGRLLDMNAANGHVGRAHADYLLLRQFGIDTVRESIGWRLVERDGVFDFSVLDERLLAARALNIQICWTFCHYGWPPEVDVYAPEFVTRFARFCGAAAAYLARFAQPGDPAPVYSPINEISFTSWGLSVHMFRCKNRDDPRAATEGKRQLVRATLAGCDAIWAVTPGARILHCDPLIHVIAPTGSPEWQTEADGASAAQYDAWDMLCGRREPELGGAPRYLDIIGANYYDTNQWESGTNARLWWHLGDVRRKPLHRCLLDLHRRYHRPVLLAETSHVGSGRGAWVVEMAHQVALALQHGVAMQGICLYPIVDRNDWEHEHHWHRSGLWDLDRDGPDPLARQLVATYGAALQQGRRLITHLFEEIETGYHPQGHLRESTMDTVIVFCHLRWDFVYQRPQHLLTRLAQHYKVLFIEEPVFDEAAPHLRTYHPAPNVTVCQPHTPVPAPGFHDDQIPVLQSLLANLVPDGEDPVVWFYTPMALPLLAKLHPSLVVYDCMDELSAFKNPPRQLLQRESALLGIADLVFTGGPSLYEAKRPRHANVHCFPSSVDTVHFEQALDRSNAHPLHADIAHPRLGFYGVIDERFDTALIAAMADAHPAWQIVLVGPVVKIAPEDLPQRPNIHYLGQQSYQALPQFLAGWDVCLLPFALNESTRYISPTKVLEYMAAELPIVSTAITDVEVPYGDIVAIGHDHAEFIAHCAAALQRSPAGRTTMAAHMREVAARTSWDGTADQMQALIESTPANTSAQLPGNVAALAVGGNDTATAGQVPNYGEANKVNPLRAGAPVNETACLIIGGGPTGLSAAYHGDADTVLLERNATVGGWCRSIEDAGFTFDYAGHIMFSNDPYVLKLYDILLGDNQHWQMREAWVYSKQVFTRYPFQGALYGLPPDVIKECIVGPIDARYGVAEAPVCEAGTVEDCCADGTADVANAGGTARQERTQSFEEFIYKVWGSGIAKHFAIPYNKKLWTVPLAEMETSWLGGRWPGAAARPGPDHRRRPATGSTAHGPECPLWLSVKRRVPGTGVGLPAAHQGQDRAQCRRGAGAAEGARGGAGRWPPLPLR